RDSALGRTCPEYVPKNRAAFGPGGLGCPSPGTLSRSPAGCLRVERKRGPVWYAKYRLPDGRQVQRKIGPASTGRSRPPAVYLTERAAEAWLRDLLHEAAGGTLPGMVQTGVTFADAASEFLCYAERDRGCKPSTLCGYGSTIEAHLLSAFRCATDRVRHR